MTTSVAVIGANGRMGSLACRLIEQSDDFRLAAGIGSSGDLSEMLQADLAIDFTVPEVSPAVVEYAVAHGVPILVGTSGWSAERVEELETTIGGKFSVGVIIVPNFSLGSVLATRLAVTAARFFDSVEIIEAHHEHKIDSPSGTAVRTAELITEARGARGPVDAPFADQPARGQQVAGVPVHSLRMHGVAARQQVILGGAGEQLMIQHDTLSASAYEAGIMLALRALPKTRGVVVGLDRLLGLDDEGASPS